MGPRAKLLALAAIFALPMAASFVAYHFVKPEPKSNGELLLPPQPITGQAFASPSGAGFAFPQLAGRWALVTSDAGACPQACRGKLTTLRQVRLALGRNASRVERVFVVDDIAVPASMQEFEGMFVAMTPAGLALAPGPANDRAHIYLVDPRGNVMMRWPADTEPKKILSDLQRLLKASQIG